MKIEKKLRLMSVNIPIKLYRALKPTEDTVLYLYI